MAEPKKIEVLVYRVGKPGVLETINDDLKSLQALVCGYIEAYTLTPGITLICNEEGRLRGFKPNREVKGGASIVGDFFVCRKSSSGNMLSLTSKDVEKVRTLIEAQP